MQDHLLSRRRFLQSTAAALGALPAAMNASVTGASSGEAVAPSGDAVGTVHRGIFPEHGNLLRVRSEAMRDRLRDAARAGEGRPVTLGVWQMRNHCDGEAGKKENLQHMLAGMERAAHEGVQVLVLPEMCLSGYFTPLQGSPADARKANRALAEVVGQSPYLDALRDQARKTRLVVTFGFGLREGEKVFNAAGVIDADGTWLGLRRKNPLYPWPYEVDSFDQPAAEERAAIFDTRYGRMGVVICFDGEFPETVRRLRLMGAEALLWCNAAIGSPKVGTSNRIGHCGCHAVTNRMWVASANCAAENSSGTSLITAIDGEPLVILPPAGEGLGVATVNLAWSANWSEYRDRLDPLWQHDPAASGHPRA